MVREACAFGLLMLLAVPTQVAADEAKSPDARAGLPFAAHRYELTASLDPAKKQVQGAARITFTNTSAGPLDALLFHLYLNAFRDDDSVFMRESGGVLRGQVARGDGSIELQSLVVAGHDVLSTVERELVPKDRTQLRVPLATPLAPGERLVVELRFLSKLPPVFARSGYAGDFFAVGQWFPKLAKLDADGFVSFPYHALGEFYADFADYSLEVDAPADFSMVASGALQEELSHGKRVTRRFSAEHVHDVAFVAGRNYTLDVESVDGVLVRYLSPPGYQAALAQHAEVVRGGLRRFGELFGSYPYPALSVVLPPRDAPGAAGMEYPTLLTSAGPWFTLSALPALGGAVVTAHELAHQWFYGLLASDELHHPVLDEGLTEWASLDLMRALYGAREGIAGITLDRFEVERALAVRSAGIAPGLAAYEYGPNEYASSVYCRAAAALESIRRAYGSKRFERALGLYASRHRFGHPTPDDLASAFDDVYGPLFSDSTLRPLLFAGQDSAVRITSARSRFEDTDYVTHVRARREGVALPTWLALYGTRGQLLARTPWPARESSLLVNLHTRDPVARVVLDPDRALLLDANVSDQLAELRPSSSPPLLSHLLAASELLLAWLGP
jgi:Peptidase family M1 domain